MMVLVIQQVFLLAWQSWALHTPSESAHPQRLVEGQLLQMHGQESQQGNDETFPQAPTGLAGCMSGDFDAQGPEKCASIQNLKCEVSGNCRGTLQGKMYEINCNRRNECITHAWGGKMVRKYFSASAYDGIVHWNNGCSWICQKPPSLFRNKARLSTEAVLSTITFRTVMDEQQWAAFVELMHTVPDPPSLAELEARGTGVENMDMAFVMSQKPVLEKMPHDQGELMEQIEEEAEGEKTKGFEIGDAHWDVVEILHASVEVSGSALAETNFAHAIPVLGTLIAASAVAVHFTNALASIKAAEEKYAAAGWPNYQQITDFIAFQHMDKMGQASQEMAIAKLRGMQAVLDHNYAQLNARIRQTKVSIWKKSAPEIAIGIASFGLAAASSAAVFGLLTASAVAWVPVLTMVVAGGSLILGIGKLVTAVNGGSLAQIANVENNVEIDSRSSTSFYIAQLQSEAGAGWATKAQQEDELGQSSNESRSKKEN